MRFRGKICCCFFCPQALNWKITRRYDDPLCRQTYWFIPKRLVVTFSSRAKLALMLTVVHGRAITMGRLEAIVPRINWIVSFEPFLGSKGWKVDNYTGPGGETSPARPLGLKSNRLLQSEQQISWCHPLFVLNKPSIKDSLGQMSCVTVPDGPSPPFGSDEPLEATQRWLGFIDNIKIKKR